MSKSTFSKSRIMLSYWGRRGALTLFTHQIGKAALDIDGLRTTISISRQNEEFSSYKEFGSALYPTDTFNSNVGSILNLWKTPAFRKRLRERLQNDETEIVIELMPHVWSPLIMSMLKNEGVKYATIVHDATRHPGDYRSIVNDWMKRCVRIADHVITLSDHVADQLQSAEPEISDKIVRLYHPNLTSAVPPLRSRLDSDQPFRLLFMGRIMKYKGLPVLVEAVEKVVAKGHKIKLGIFGEGQLNVSLDRLKALDAEVHNKWLMQDEISDILGRYDAMALSHLEASQSGVLALAHGAHMPVIATPVGGLTQQITHEWNGILSEDVSSTALAEAIETLITKPDLYTSIQNNILTEQEKRSPKSFIEECVRKLQD